ncbi:MAG: ABC transporter ATP-binding protein [Rhizobiaceae bacterium]
MPNDQRTASAGALLVLSDIHAGYDEREVLHSVSMTVDRGEFVCIIGANTAGKSTLLRCISRIVPRARGSMRFAGRELFELAAHQIPALGIAHVPEGRHVFSDMTVEENLCLGAFSRRRKVDLKAALEPIYAMFPRLAERRLQRVGTMSGGEQQMVAVGRALMLDPQLLILDEPSHGLAPILVEELHEAFRKINLQGTAILLVEQNTAIALKDARRGYVLQSGRIVLEGSAEVLAGDDALREAYLGI